MIEILLYIVPIGFGGLALCAISMGFFLVRAEIRELRRNTALLKQQR